MSGTTLAIVLAAGEGTRMNSAKPKVLHKVAGQTLLARALGSVVKARFAKAAVVVGPNHQAVADEARRVMPGVDCYVQTERRGTAHAVLQARSSIAEGYDAVVVLFGDTPLVRTETVQRLAAAVHGGAGVAVMGFHAKDPTGYGRLLTDGGELLAIREHKDATDAERQVTLCNGGMMALSGRRALELLDAIDDNNAQKEFYLTSAVEVARAEGMLAVVVEVPELEAFGVNDRLQQAMAEAVIQKRLRQEALRSGVTLIAPETVFLAPDTKIGRDVVIEPNVVFGPGVVIDDGAVIHAFSHIEGAHIGKGASVGPFARLRPGADLAVDVKVGNFVEVKNAKVAEGAKISHLSYIGDATVGAEANIGAGTITCNYDGFRKFVTEIGAGAFVGSNSALVAPVKIGDGAYVGSGSVVTKDVPANALAVARGHQMVKAGWADSFRARPENVAKKKT
ncbi:MAG: bifunctional UDP-N-acetylglucosamine diphosphorylase/glucosamine-1-phosphate N-acetyltransferase GlmU [Proteobacteria bacterium]|nr:bifunctional UDP-N-acetylglucosamine diphosphorylase/glucosamine-1-phosphate N-acetyltransferase GlmU [Pseudomonadota bacterium]